MIERNTFIPFGNTADHSIDYLLGILEDARTTTLLRIGGITTEELHWQYAEGWNTVGALLSHFIACSDYFRIYYFEKRELTEEEKKSLMPGLEMGKYLPELIRGESVEVYTEQLEKSRNLFLDEIKKLSREAFFEKIEGYNPNTGCNLAWVLYHVAEDEVNHRGQIALIRKLYRHAKADKIG